MRVVVLGLTDQGLFEDFRTDTSLNLGANKMHAPYCVQQDGNISLWRDKMESRPWHMKHMDLLYAGYWPYSPL